MGNFQTQKYILNGNRIDSPTDWRGVKIKADFTGNIQPKIDIESLTFVNESLEPILKHIEEGRIFEGIDLDIEVSDEEFNYTTFNGILDPSTYDQITPNKIEFSINAIDDLENIFNRLEGITALLLYSKGYLRNQKDINFVVEPKVDAVYVVTTLLTIFLLSKELAEAIKTTADTIEDLSNWILTLPVPNPQISGKSLIVKTSINLAYTGAIAFALISLLNDMLSKFIQPTRTNKAISWGDVLRDCSDYLGYGFNTSIDDIDMFVQMPSNQSSIPFVFNGIPNAQDYGYNMQDFFRQVLVQFNSQMAVIDGVIELHPVWSDFWYKTSTFVMPSNIHEKDIFRFNTNDLVRSRELIYRFDISEEYTDDEAYRVQAGSVLEQGVDGYKDLLKGLETNQINHSLGSRKEKLSDLEDVLTILVSVSDALLSTLGQSSNYANKIFKRVGMLRLSTANYAVSKLLYTSGGNLPSNHAEKLNAKTLFEKYYLPSSFANGNQKKVYEGVKIPFNLKFFNQLRENSYFIGSNGAISKVNSIEWEIDSDTAIINYEEDFTYTNKLTERIL